MINNHEDYEAGLWLGRHCCGHIQGLLLGHNVSIPRLPETRSPELPDPSRK